MAEESGRPRLVLVHGWAPPTRGGTSIIVERLLGELNGVNLDVWTRVTQWRGVRRRQFVLPGRYRYFPKLRSVPRGPRSLAWVVTSVNAVLAVVSGLVIGLYARREGATWVVSVVDEGASQIAGWVAARVARLPHLIWVFDVWEENAYAASDRRVARCLEGTLWRSAAAIIVHAEELSEHYDRKHGARGHVLRTPIDQLPVPPAAARSVTDPDRDGFEVVVAGSVYWAQVEALHRVAAAVSEVAGAHLTIVGDPALQVETVAADRYEPAHSAEALRDRLAQADLLVLALSFDSPYPEVIRTATPARLPEYLASGVPLLVHAPPESHAARHVRRWDLGTVVDAPDTAAVADAIRTIKREVEQYRRRAVRAREFAMREHAATRVRAGLFELLESVQARGAARSG